MRPILFVHCLQVTAEQPYPGGCLKHLQSVKQTEGWTPNASCSGRRSELVNNGRFEDRAASGWTAEMRAHSSRNELTRRP